MTDETWGDSIMKYRKAITYAYPTSARAEELGCPESGCWFVSLSVRREDDTWSPEWPVDPDGFVDMNDSNLVALYHEVDADPCPFFLRYGSAAHLVAG